MPRFRILAAFAATGLLLAGCQTATPYQPRATPTSTAGGYSDQQLAPGRFRVSFAGNSLTSRETVETYLLYRAAELTARQGYDWFELAARETEHERETRVDRAFPSRYPLWHPYWRYWSPSYGWRTWDPYWGDPFWADTVDMRTIDRYQASAEIIMHRGAVPAGDPDAFDANEVLANLRDQIRFPEDGG